MFNGNGKQNVQPQRAYRCIENMGELFIALENVRNRIQMRRKWVEETQSIPKLLNKVMKTLMLVVVLIIISLSYYFYIYVIIKY
jgi:hypothetical protein